MKGCFVPKVLQVDPCISKHQSSQKRIATAHLKYLLASTMMRTLDNAIYQLVLVGRNEIFHSNKISLRDIKKSDLIINSKNSPNN